MTRSKLLYGHHIERLVNGYKSTEQVKSVPTPSAQVATMCQQSSNEEVIINRIMYVIESKTDVPRVVRAVLELLFLNGCRISEVLSICGRDVTRQGHIYMRGGKGSQDRVLVSAVHRDFWLKMRGGSWQLGSVYSRFFFYHRFRRLGVQLSRVGYQKKAVTHAMRHLVVRNVSDTDIDDAAISTYIGHKSEKNLKYYKREKEEEKKKEEG